MATEKKAVAPKRAAACTSCKGLGATDVVPMNARNTESHHNKYGTSLKLGISGTHMGATCTNCGGSGNKKAK
jgi:DnaJ-class molecular chaperone